MQIRHSAPVLLLLLMLGGTWLWNQFQGKSDDATLKAADSVCLDGQACNIKASLMIGFSPDPVTVETEIKVKLFLADGWILKKAWVEGVNMYMGKSPLIIDNIHHQNKEITAIMFLGSCSEANMHWRITTVWEADKQVLESSTNQTVISTYDFFTNR